LEYFLFVLTLLVIVQAGIRKGVQIVVSVCLGFVLAFGPWVARNLVTLGVSGDPGLVTATLQHGMYPNFMYENNPDSYGSPCRYDPHAHEFRGGLRSVLSEIKRRFAEEPWTHLKWYLIGKPLAFWSWNEVQGSGEIPVFPVNERPYHDSPLFEGTYFLMKLVHWPLVFLAAVGFIVAWLPVSSRRLGSDRVFMRMNSVGRGGYPAKVHLQLQR
jgi:hypothetical protein